MKGQAEKITETEKIILNLISSSLFNTDVFIPDINSLDWNKIYIESRAQAVLPIVFSAAKSYIPSSMQVVWNRVRNVIVNNLRIEYEHTELHKILSENNIPYVVMKGMASAVYYPEPTLRVMGDVDFLVDKNDLARAGKALEANGFKAVEDNESVCHIAYHKGNSVWEMHWEPNGIPQSKEGDLVREYLSDSIEKAEFYKSGDGGYFLPSAFHHGVIILLHTATHLINTGIGLRHLYDWAVLVNSIPDEQFTKLFKEKLTATGLWRFAQLLTLLSTKYLGCRECKWAGNADDNVLEAMMIDILAGGNFGQKDSERINQAKLMTNQSKGTVSDTGLLRQLVNTMNEKARIGMPAVKKYPVLIPIGWIYVGGRHIGRIISGRRSKIHAGNMIKGANKRKEIYQQFHLFDASMQKDFGK